MGLRLASTNMRRANVMPRSSLSRCGSAHAAAATTAQSNATWTIDGRMPAILPDTGVIATSSLAYRYSLLDGRRDRRGPDENATDSPGLRAADASCPSILGDPQQEQRVVIGKPQRQQPELVR